MLEEELGELPYVLWYQCRFCTHLFYNEQKKIVAHLREKHGYAGGEVEEEGEVGGAVRQGHQGPSRNGQGPSSLLKRSGPPKMTPSAAVSSASEGDGEEAEDVINNNNNIKHNNNQAVQKKMPRLVHKNDITRQPAAPAPAPMTVTPSSGPATRGRNSLLMGGGIKRVVPSLDELKKQLVSADIDISEIKMGFDGNVGPGGEEEEVEEEDEGMMEYGDEFGDGAEGYGMEESYEEGEENSEDAEEGASTSNHSFYDNGLGEHFLFKSEGDEDGEEEDEGAIMTPNFGMVDELYRSARMVQNSNSGEGGNVSVRRRSFHNPCKLCNKVFPSLSMLKKHAKTHLNEDGGTQHLCKFCFEYFPSAAGLSKHLRVHTEENPNVCQTCQKSFTSWATLRTHMKIHSGERPFGCDICSQRFQTKSTLDSHLRIHSGSRPHICGICSKSFRTSSPLYRHMRSVHKGLNIQVGSVTINS